jgi:hypothetical protein
MGRPKKQKQSKFEDDDEEDKISPEEEAEQKEDEEFMKTRTAKKPSKAEEMDNDEQLLSEEDKAEMQEDKQLRNTPLNELDMQMILTEPQWGNVGISQELKQRLQSISRETIEGSNVISTQDLWGLLDFYTRDLRLGNLSTMNGEVNYCRYYLDLAGDCLREGYYRSFVKCLSLTVTVLEISQSRGGFLRTKQSTIRKENIYEEREPKKTSLFGKQKPDEFMKN